MRPVKIIVSELDKAAFFSVITRLFPVFEQNPPEYQEKVWNLYSGFRIIVLDLMSGALLHGLTPQGWMLLPEYIDNIPTHQTIWDAVGSENRDDLDEYIRNQSERQRRGETEYARAGESEPREFSFSQKRMDALIDKMMVEKLTLDDQKYLDQCSQYLREKD